MKAMLTAFVAIVIIAFGSNAFLERAGFSSQERGSGDNVRLDG